MSVYVSLMSVLNYLNALILSTSVSHVSLLCVFP